MVKKLLPLFLSLFSLTMISQERQSLISGKIVDSLGVVKNVNIINLKTRQGTISFDDGSFQIFASEGDSIKISTVQHISKKININKDIINKKSLIIRLKLNTYVLDAFDLRRNNLTGSLSLDLKTVPKNKKDSLLKNTMDFSKVNMKRAEADDYIDKRVRPQKVETDPNALFVGAGGKLSMAYKNSERLWALRKKLARKKEFPYKVLSELGEQFFFKKLKVPVDRYFHFLEYCNPLGIENLHKEGKLLELIKIFEKESIPYLKIIKKE